MSKIKILSPHEAQKIAAGQVVERPANIVKELIENALDANATAITLSINEGGKQSIVVTDNGEGMTPEDAQLCFVKHATSKIVSVDQLTSISTFGFRGEALASIAAVSKVTLRTAQESALQATQIIITPDNQLVSNVAGNKGTEIIVEDLFYTIPVRKKFLKTDQTEYRQIHQLMQAFCLNHPTIHFKFFSDNHLIFNCAPVTTLLQRAAQLWPPNTVEQLSRIEQKRHDGSVSIEGIISDQHFGAYDRSNIFFLVNNRWVKNHKLTSALLKGYQNVLSHNRFPLACVRITIDPLLIDINIHPRKEEIRFMHPVIVEQLIAQGVQKGLEKNISSHLAQSTNFQNTVSSSSFNSSRSAFPSTQELFIRSFNNETKVQNISDTRNNTPRHEITTYPSVETSIAPTLYNTVSVPAEPPLQMDVQTNHIAEQFTIIGQYHNTYILLEKPEGLFLVDQHAAHERILYELFTQRFEQVMTINLLFPTIIALTVPDVTLIEPYLSIITQNGIEIEPFGPDKLIIKSTPVYLKDQSLQDLIQQMISWIHEAQTLEPSLLAKTITEKLHAQMACKAAVKAGDVLTRETMIQLLTDLEKTNNSFCCPHGRPTSWLIRLDEIERKFKRKGGS